MRYKQIEDNEIDVIYPEKEYEMSACCDCGLVHDINYKIAGDKILIKITRNNRATGQRRRWMKVRKGGMFNSGKPE